MNLENAINKIKAAEFELGGVESNGRLIEEGGWVNGHLTIDDESFGVGGGWILGPEEAERENARFGMSYQGGGPDPYAGCPGFHRPGDLIAYGGRSEEGDLRDLVSYLGLDPDDDGVIDAIEEVIQEMTFEAFDPDDEGAEYTALCCGKEKIIERLKSAIARGSEEDALQWTEIAEAGMVSLTYEVADGGVTLYADGVKIARATPDRDQDWLLIALVLEFAGVLTDAGDLDDEIQVEA